ncbi:carbohydrate kinase FGGY [Fictibacillus macauensis ZFHKF-1]|uniref:Carbohydrate kinase FGGY n=1 Tax=Fictibacillus macauensis ZFHKF-1 TaxID=1196324 RepID=I8IXT2_9BACL|nr:FGGY-family carbohydrate kinase [Fictibacillus macauensis]EIT84296.1 carbohydrate kinase FGGY [Fictibacillus macauensis ZFHKF-1]
MTKLLGIDNGSTVTKASVFTLQGEELAVASAPSAVQMVLPGHTERDMNDLWQTTLTVIKEALTLANVAPKDITGVAVTGHGNGLYLVDAAGQPVRPAILSSDHRAKELVQMWEDGDTKKAVFPMTMQSLWAGQPPALLAWLQQNEPESLHKTRWIFLCKDYIRFKLTGQAAAERTDLSGSSLFNSRDNCYDHTLLSHYGLQTLVNKLPPVISCDEVAGHITEEVAQVTGLRAGTPVAGGLFDVNASAIASGLTDEEKLCIVAGTWSINEYITKTPVIDPSLFMTSRYCLPNYWLTLEGSPTSTSNLEWYLKEYFPNEHKETLYALCNELVMTIAPEESDILFFPYVYGSNVHPEAKGCFFGINSWHTKAHMLRALYEGVVFGHKIHLEKLLRHRKSPALIRLAGGAARSTVWTQLFADILGYPIQTVESREQGALGAAMCAAVATKQYASLHEAAQHMVHTGNVYFPNEQHQTIYEAKYTRFHSVLHALEHVW